MMPLSLDEHVHQHAGRVANVAISIPVHARYPGSYHGTPASIYMVIVQHSYN